MKRKRFAVYSLIGIFAVVLLGWLFVRDSSPAPFPYKILFRIGEHQWGGETRFSLDIQTKENVANINGENSRIVFEVKNIGPITQLSLLGLEAGTEGWGFRDLSSPYQEFSPVDAGMPIELETGENFLEINNGKNTDKYKIILDDTAIKIKEKKTRFSEPIEKKIVRQTTP